MSDWIVRGGLGKKMKGSKKENEAVRVDTHLRVRSAWPTPSVTSGQR